MSNKRQIITKEIKRRNQVSFNHGIMLYHAAAAIWSVTYGGRRESYCTFGLFSGQAAQITIDVNLPCDNISVTDRVSTKRRKYFGHVARLPPHRNPKIALEGQVQGIRPWGHPPEKWLDCLAKDCEERSIQSLYQAGRMALDRKTWQHLLMQKPSQGDLPVWTA